MPAVPARSDARATNHLDIEAIGRLQDALVGYQGSLLLATHDQSLADAVTTITWRVRDGRVEVGGVMRVDRGLPPERCGRRRPVACCRTPWSSQGLPR